MVLMMALWLACNAASATSGGSFEVAILDLFSNQVSGSALGWIVLAVAFGLGGSDLFVPWATSGLFENLLSVLGVIFLLVFFLIHPSGFSVFERHKGNSKPFKPQFQTQ
jgi:hypothetical protein